MGCFPLLGVFGKAFSVGRNLTWHRHSLPCVEPRRQGERGASWGSLDEKGAHDTARDTRRGLEAARNGWGDVGRYVGFRMSWLCGALVLRGIARCCQAKKRVAGRAAYAGVAPSVSKAGRTGLGAVKESSSRVSACLRRCVIRKQDPQRSGVLQGG